jgi:hypothetical protein
MEALKWQHRYQSRIGCDRTAQSARGLLAPEGRPRLAQLEQGSLEKVAISRPTPSVASRITFPGGSSDCTPGNRLRAYATTSSAVRMRGISWRTKVVTFMSGRQ